MKSNIILIGTIVVSVLLLFIFFGCTETNTTNNNNTSTNNNVINNDKNINNPTQPVYQKPDVNLNKINWSKDGNMDYKLMIFNDRYNSSKGLQYSINNYSIDLTSNKAFNMKLMIDVFDQSGNFVDSSELNFNIKQGRQILSEKSLGTVKKRGIYKITLKGYDEKDNLVLELKDQEVKMGFDYSKKLVPDLNAKLSVVDFETRANSVFGLRYDLKVRTENLGNTDLLTYLKQEFYVDGKPMWTIYSAVSPWTANMFLDYSKLIEKSYEYYYIGTKEGSNIKIIELATEGVMSPEFGRDIKSGQKIKAILSLVDIENEIIVASGETPEIIVK